MPKQQGPGDLPPWVRAFAVVAILIVTLSVVVVLALGGIGLTYYGAASLAASPQAPSAGDTSIKVEFPGFELDATTSVPAIALAVLGVIVVALVIFGLLRLIVIPMFRFLFPS